MATSIGDSRTGLKPLSKSSPALLRMHEQHMKEELEPCGFRQGGPEDFQKTHCQCHHQGTGGWRSRRKVSKGPPGQFENPKGHCGRSWKSATDAECRISIVAGRCQSRRVAAGVSTGVCRSIVVEKCPAGDRCDGSELGVDCNVVVLLANTISRASNTMQYLV